MAEMANSKIILSGFELEPIERAVIETLVRSYENKLNQKLGFEEAKIRMKKSLHGKAFLHELQGSLILMNREILNAKTSGYNLNSALSELFEKLINEAIHRQRKK